MVPRCSAGLATARLRPLEKRKARATASRRAGPSWLKCHVPRDTGSRGFRHLRAQQQCRHLRIARALWFFRGRNKQNKTQGVPGTMGARCLVLFARSHRAAATAHCSVFTGTAPARQPLPPRRSLTVARIVRWIGSVARSLRVSSAGAERAHSANVLDSARRPHVPNLHAGSAQPRLAHRRLSTRCSPVRATGNKPCQLGSAG